MQIVIEIPEEDYERLKAYKKAPFCSFPSRIYEAIAHGTPLPEHHGDLKDIGNMELLNVQVHDDYSKGWHNAIEYCVRQLRERTTVIPATKEGTE